MTLVETLGAVACAVVFIAIVFFLFLPGRHGSGSSPLLRNQVHVQQIHKAHVMHAEEYESAEIVRGGPRMLDPATSDLDELFDSFALRVPGPPEAQTTASIYARMIMQNFYDPQLLISPLEKSTRVVEYEEYDYDAYDPVHGVLWDPGFQTDLATISHTSYAHVVPTGERARRIADFDSDIPAFGDRGPAGGVEDPDSVTTDRRGAWLGCICWADNHVVVEQSMNPRTRNDNIFAVDDGFDGADGILSFVAAIRDGTPVLQHD